MRTHYLAAPMVLLAISLLSCSATSTPAQQTPAMVKNDAPACPIPKISAPRTLPKPAGTAFWAPAAPEYPYPATEAERVALEAYAECLSLGLTRYIQAWRRGEAPAELPEALIPWGTNREDFATLTLRDPATMSTKDQWVVRPAHKIDPNALYGSFPDTNATYLVAPALLAPFGSTLTIEGEFPYARYFSAQATPPFDLDVYRYDLGVGAGEVPILDVDIEAAPGHTNPFRVGADRMAARRNYRIEFDLVMGEPVDLNPKFRAPAFRAPGNRAYASGLVFEGPWGHPESAGHGRGLLAPGQLWLRYYAADFGRGPLAGVDLPRMKLRLPSGESFFIEADLKGIISVPKRDDR